MSASASRTDSSRGEFSKRRHVAALQNEHHITIPPSACQPAVATALRAVTLIRTKKRLTEPWLQLLHHDSAIDAQHLASDVARFGRCKKRHRARDLIRRAGSSQRDLRVNRILNFI